jgi:hypothetical protein
MGNFNIRLKGEFSFSQLSIYIRDNRRIISHRKQNQPKQKSTKSCKKIRERKAQLKVKSKHIFTLNNKRKIASRQ